MFAKLLYVTHDTKLHFVLRIAHSISLNESINSSKILLKLLNTTLLQNLLSVIAAIILIEGKSAKEKKNRM